MTHHELPSRDAIKVDTPLRLSVAAKPAPIIMPGEETPGSTRSQAHLISFVVTRKSLDVQADD